MFDSYQKSTGVRYTSTVALLLIAFVFSPAALILYRPFGYMSLSLAAACTVLFAGLAWVSWTKYSELTIPTLEASSPRAR